MNYKKIEKINFCPHCGALLQIKERFGKPHPFCPVCDRVYFSDPKVAVAVLIERDHHVLLVRRAVDPQRGLWTLPAGFVDADEDPKVAAVRECLEETGLQVNVTDLIDVLYGREHPRGAHILIAYRAKIIAGELKADDDVDEVAFFPCDDLPLLAFKTTKKILQC